MIANIYKLKRVNDCRYLTNFLNESYQLYSIDNDNEESENVESQNPFDYNFILENINRENEYNSINNASMMNSFNINNEQNNFHL